MKKVLVVLLLSIMLLLVSCMEMEKASKNVVVADTVNLDDFSSIKTLKYDINMKVKTEDMKEFQIVYTINNVADENKHVMTFKNNEIMEGTTMELSKHGILMKSEKLGINNFLSYDEMQNNALMGMAAIGAGDSFQSQRYDFETLKAGLFQKSIKSLYKSTKNQLMSEDDPEYIAGFEEFLLELYESQELIENSDGTLSLISYADDMKITQIYDPEIEGVTSGEILNNSEKLQDFYVDYIRLDDNTMSIEKIHQTNYLGNTITITLIEYDNIHVIGHDDLLGSGK